MRDNFEHLIPHVVLFVLERVRVTFDGCAG